jgi:predicted anti-sigma-YlaC factor YlaD
MTGEHPTEDELRRFQLLKLTVGVAGKVYAHLRSCPTCNGLYTELANETDDTMDSSAKVDE